MIDTNTSLENSAIGTHRRVLNDIHQDHKNIAIYKRDIKALAPHIERALKASVQFRAHGSVTEIKDTIDTVFNSNPDLPGELIQDINHLLELFNHVSGSSSFNLLLATVNTNMCRRFHTDMNDLRMLCTYSGPGTLWLTEDNVNREALYTKEDNDSIVTDSNKIQKADTGSAIILKGGLYPKEGTKAIVHRSPTIEESGTRRLMLRIDTNDFLGAIVGQ